MDSFGRHGRHGAGKDPEAYRSAQKPANGRYHRQFPGAPPLSLSPAQLDRARRDWLADLARQFALHPSGANALRLASGEWKCGEYEASLPHFVAARDLSPGVAEPHVALVYSAAMLGRRALEDEALAQGLRAHPGHPRLLLHAARRLIPDDWDAAREWLRPVLADPACALFDRAMAGVIEGRKPDLQGSERERAKLEGLHWLMDHGAGRQVHAGMPTDVLLRALDAARVPGLTLECGVYFGRSLGLIAAASAGEVHGFDSFQGLPEAWNANEGAGAYSTGGRLPRVPGNATLHAGWFEETLPAFFASHSGSIRLLHVDCDIYSSTRTVLENALPRLAPGSTIVFDDFLGYPGYEQHELRAFQELVRAHGIGWELIAANLLGREVALRITRI